MEQPLVPLAIEPKYKRLKELLSGLTLLLALTLGLLVYKAAAAPIDASQALKECGSRHDLTPTELSAVGELAYGQTKLGWSIEEDHSNLMAHCAGWVTTLRSQ